MIKPMEQTRTFFSLIRRYFAQYGGWGGVFLSPFFLLAALVTGISYGSWIEPKWISLAQSLIPNLLGFSLGTYAILFNIMTGRLKRALRERTNPNGTPYLFEMNATFFHFIFLQVIALLWALLFSGTALYDLAHASKSPTILCLFAAAKIIGSAAGFFLLVYAFLLTIAAALVVYRLAGIYDPHAT
jgi:hypothetical protein